MPAEQDDYDKAVMAEMGERCSVLEAELLAAQERLENTERIAEKAKRELVEAQEREKELRKTLERIRDATFAGKWMQQVATEALAGSPSQSPTVRPEAAEKPGSEEEKHG